MKKYLFYFLILTNILCELKIISCPYSFSYEDQRPFFEQYAIENNSPITNENKENKEIS